MGIGYLEKRRRRRALSDALRRQLRADLAELLTEQPDLLEAPGASKTITAQVLRVGREAAADLPPESGGEASAAAAAQRRPSQDWKAGRRRLAELSEQARERAGTIEPRGDETLVLWNAPFDQRDHHRRACLAALEASADRHAVGTSIGIATGPAAVGMTEGPGGPAYAACGEVVELAAELARLASMLGVRALASEETIAASRGVILARELDMVTLAEGCPRVRIFELLGKAEEFERFAERFEYYGPALAAYRGRRWRDARRGFEQAVAALPDDRPAKWMLRRCRRLEESEPPGHWTPVVVLRPPVWLG